MIRKIWTAVVCLVLLLQACRQNQKTVSRYLTLSPYADSIVEATRVLHNKISDSLLTKYDSAQDINGQLLALNQFLENKKLLSPRFSREVFALSQQHKSLYNQVYATINSGMAFSSVYQFDSSFALLTQAIAQARHYRYDSLVALAYFQKGLNHYMLDAYDTALAELDTCILYAERVGDQNKKLQALALTGSVYAFKSEFRKSIQILLSVFDKSRQSNNLPVQGGVCFSAGQSYLMLNEVDSALFYLQKATDIGRQLNDKSLQVRTSAAMVNLLSMQAEYGKSLQLANEGVKLSQELHDRTSEAFFLNAIGDAYRQRTEYAEALPRYRKALILSKNLKDDYRTSLLLVNIGELLSHASVKNMDSSFYYTRQGLNLSVKLGDQLRTSDALSTLGTNFFLIKNYDSSEVYFNRALKVARSIGYLNKVSFSLNFLVEINMVRKQYTKAQVLMKELSALSATDNIVANREGYLGNAYQLYKHQGDYKKALFYLEKYKATTDSTSSAAKAREMSRIEYESKTDRLKAEQEKKDIVYKARQREKEEEIRRSALVRNFLIGGLFILLVLLFFIFRSLVANRKAKKTIEEQKREVELSRDSIREQKKIIEEKNTEIVQSITYAEGIQRAILASENDIKKVFPESFLLFIPKDIVAGDFYFFEKTSTHVFYAAADCTGHGVPGALVSMICSNALRRCVNEYKLTDPGKILDKARELVIETFEKSGKNVKDGMDISLVSLKFNDANLKPETLNFELQWAGAHNPLWYIQNGSMTEITANKQSIGLSEKPSAFVTHNIRLSKGDTFYLFTDGYADQFGGPRGKKLKYKTLQDLLLGCQHLEPKDQVITLRNQFLAWKGDLEQVDDVCVIGIRI